MAVVGSVKRTALNSISLQGTSWQATWVSQATCLFKYRSNSHCTRSQDYLVFENQHGKLPFIFCRSGIIYRNVQIQIAQFRILLKGFEQCVCVCVFFVGFALMNIYCIMYVLCIFVLYHIYMLYMCFVQGEIEKEGFLSMTLPCLNKGLNEKWMNEWMNAGVTITSMLFDSHDLSYLVTPYHHD